MERAMKRDQREWVRIARETWAANLNPAMLSLEVLAARSREDSATLAKTFPESAPLLADSDMIRFLEVEAAIRKAER